MTPEEEKDEVYRIKEEIRDCKTIAQINRLYARYFKELVRLNYNVSKVLIPDKGDVIAIASIFLIYDRIEIREEQIIASFNRMN